MYCDITRCAICMPNNVEFCQRSFTVNLSDLYNAVKKMPSKGIFCLRHLMGRPFVWAETRVF